MLHNRSSMFSTYLLAGALSASADNPFITHRFTADPTARCFDGRIYIYPSHDIPEFGDFRGENSFMMSDYHVYSTADLMHYTDHGMILHQDDVEWLEKDTFEMWAPCAETKNGKYYFYFPAKKRVGVAIAETPVGPFKPEPKPVEYTHGIDPNIFIDKDGTPYLFFGHGDNIQGMRMKEDMITPDMMPVKIEGLPKEYKEGSFVFERNGIYYFTFPYSAKGPEEIRYAMGLSPLGPYKAQDNVIIGKRHTSTVHHSIIPFKDQWYLFYHHADLSNDGTLRSICADELFFNEDGTIKTVIPTRRGVGICPAENTIQVDRYSDHEGVTCERFAGSELQGLYVDGIQDGSWLKYDRVDFGSFDFDGMSAKVSSCGAGGSIEVRAEARDGPLLGAFKVPAGDDNFVWKTVSVEAVGKVSGIQDLYLVFKGSGFLVDWIRFNKPDVAFLTFGGNGVGSIRINGISEVASYAPGKQLSVGESKHIRMEAIADYDSFFVGYELNGSPAESIEKVKAGDEIKAVFSMKHKEVNAFIPMQAERATVHHGVKVSPAYGGGVLMVEDIQAGDYVGFHNVNLKGGADNVQCYVASFSEGGKINVCSGSPESKPVAEIMIPNTGGMHRMKMVSAGMDVLSGFQDIFFCFEGTGSCAVDWMRFTPFVEGAVFLKADMADRIEGGKISLSAEEGVAVSSVNDGTMLTFKNVSFPKGISKLAVRYAAAKDGPTATVHLNEPDAEPVATLELKSTGNWGKWDDADVDVSIPEGTHRLFIKFTGGDSSEMSISSLIFE